MVVHIGHRWTKAPDLLVGMEISPKRDKEWEAQWKPVALGHNVADVGVTAMLPSSH